MKKPTVDEHIVPRTYLKAFSLPDNEKMILSYDLSAEPIAVRHVPIKSVCYEENLYEIRDSQGIIIRQNYIEDCLAQFDAMFSNHRRELISKANKSNLHCRSLLSKDEKVFWKLYIAIQFVRYPETLTTAKESFEMYLKEYMGGGMSSDIAILLCLPFFKDYDQKSRNVLNEILLLMEDLSLCVEICESERLVTSDRPLFVHSGDFPEKITFDQIVFPLTPKIQLYLHRKGETDRRYRNIMHLIDNDETDDAIRAMGFAADRFVFAGRELEARELDLLRLGRQQKQMSVENNLKRLSKKMEESL